MGYYGVEAIIRFIMHFLFIYMAFWSLQSLNLEGIFKKYKTSEIRVFYILLSLVIGYISSSCVLEIITLFKNFVLVLFQK